MLRSDLSRRRRIVALLSTVALMAGLALAFVGPQAAVGQATRTWVSGVGDDVNPCSRTAPCKTFAGAISKTAAGGEINCVDPGGYGAVTIVKSMTIDCEYTEGGALAGGNGITVNAGPTDVVTLRGLDIFGVNPPTNGIRFIAGAALHVDDVRIRRFNSVNSAGISFAPSGVSELFVSNSLIHDNGNELTGGGIVIQPTGSGIAKVSLKNVDLANNSYGVRADTTGSSTNSIKVSIIGSSATGNLYPGFSVATSGGSGPVDMSIESSMASNNGGSGIRAMGVGAVARISRSVVQGNAIGTNPTDGAVIESYQTNQIRGNTNNGTRTNIGGE